MAYKIFTTGTTPVSLEQVKEANYIVGDADNALLGVYLSAACERFTQATGFVIAESEVLYTGSTFEGLQLSYGPVKEILEVIYLDPFGEEKTIAPASIFFDDARPATIALAGRKWPQTNGMPGNVKVKYRAGHGLNESLPDLVRWAILVMVGTMYENREEVVTGTIVSPIPNSVNMVIDMYSSYKL